MQDQPLVSVICLCYNQANFVAEAIDSVLAQEYPNVELIIVDDASTDGSPKIIAEKIQNSEIPFISLVKNQGNCAAFNLGFAQSKGKYIIDLAADDILEPNRISKGISELRKQNFPEVVQYTDATIIDEQGTALYLHSEDMKRKDFPSGNLYLELIDRYFILAPTMMTHRTIFEKLNGYDESLSYEDFDFWIRSARQFKYQYLSEPLTKRRISTNSLSKKQFAIKSSHSDSTFRVCEKIKHLNRTTMEDRALMKRCLYEMKLCAKQNNWHLLPRYFKLLFETWTRKID